MYWNTVEDSLSRSLKLLMQAEEFSAFRLVGGTALSLQLGHRMSVDIDLFTDAKYGTIDFENIDRFLANNFKQAPITRIPPGMGRCYVLCDNQNETVKLDVFYTDDFIRPPLLVDGIRMASLDDIVAMKIDVILRGGRKKDFWDIHHLMGIYTIKQMIALHKERYPYGHDEAEILTGFQNFAKADEDFAPACLHGKHWELIQLDMLDAVEHI